MLCICIVAGGPRLRRVGDSAVNEIDAVPGRFEEPVAGWPEGVPATGGAALHLSGLALCGSGSASTSNVRLSERHVKGCRKFFPHITKKAIEYIETAPGGGVENSKGS
jgi:hypothetical protein